MLSVQHWQKQEWLTSACFSPEVCDVSAVVAKHPQPGGEPQGATEPPAWGSSIVKVPSGVFDVSGRKSSTGESLHIGHSTFKTHLCSDTRICKDGLSVVALIVMNK